MQFVIIVDETFPETSNLERETYKELKRERERDRS